MSQSGDPSEQKADQVAQQDRGLGAAQTPLASALPYPTTSSSGVTSLLSSAPLMIQRFPADGASASDSSPLPAETTPTSDTAAEPGIAPTPSQDAAPLGLLVEDATDQLAPGQLRKSDFLDQLESAVCATTQDALAGTLWSAAGCPWVEHWFGYYRQRESVQIERALRRYTPETAGVSSASEYIPLICVRVQRAIAVWATTGVITGVPEGISTELPATISETVSSEPSSPASGEDTPPSAEPISFKGREGGSKEAHNPQNVRGQIGSGRPLDSGVRFQMESAFGSDFSHVRVHTDSSAAGLSERLNARAFTIGQDVAFGPGEYQPGTLIGDALLAHELAHVVQQRGANQTQSTQQSDTSYNSLEEDADKSALSAVVSFWSRTKEGSVNIAQSSLPGLRSGLRLQRCSKDNSPDAGTPAAVMIDDPKKYRTFGGWLQSFPAYAGTGDPAYSAESSSINLTKKTSPELQNLIAPKLGLPPDCADVSIILRHFYLKAWNQTFSFQAGPGKGKTYKIGTGVSDDEVKKTLIDLGSVNFQEDRPGMIGATFNLVNFYKIGKVRIKNLKKLVDAGLKSGDILVWNRLSTITGPGVHFEGHVQTVQDVDKAGKKITVVQGNMSAGIGVGELQQRQFTFQELTGNPDGNADIQPRPPTSPEEEFFGGGPWR